MTPEERLEQSRVALKKRGVKDVKFCFGSLSEKPISKLSSEAADALEAVSDGSANTALPLGDSMRK
jgi:hypothetical protein